MTKYLELTRKGECTSIDAAGTEKAPPSPVAPSLGTVAEWESEKREINEK